MTWHLPDANYEKFAQNTIVSVVMELRFHPILAIDTDALVASFQGSIRGQMPRYSKESGQRIEVSHLGVKSSDQISHKFQSIDSNWLLSLSKDVISLTVQNHESRNVTVGLFEFCVTCLAEALDSNSLKIKRLGVRYVNVISKERISRDLRRQVGWSDLVSSKYFRLPDDIVDENETLFSAEINSPLEKGGMIVRYGLLPEGKEFAADPVFRFDADRYVEQSIDLREVKSTCNSLVTDVFSAFSSMKGSELECWMRGEQNG